MLEFKAKRVRIHSNDKILQTRSDLEYFIPTENFEEIYNQQRVAILPLDDS